MTILDCNLATRRHTREQAPARMPVNWGGRRQVQHTRRRGTEAVELRHPRVAAAAAAAAAVASAAAV